MNILEYSNFNLEYSKIKYLFWHWNFELAMILLWYVTQEPQTHDVQERYTTTCKNYSYRNLPMYSKLEQKTTQTSYIQIQVVISVGWVLETDTDPQQLSGRFLRFIPTSFKVSKTWFWYITVVLNFFWKKNSNNRPENCLFFFYFFHENRGFFQVFKIGKARQKILWIFFENFFFSFQKKSKLLSSLFLNHLNNWNWWFFENSNNRTNNYLF